MPSLAKAKLQEIKADASAAPISGTEIDVQFNPATLKLALANKVEGGDTRGRQSRQYLGKTSTVLSFDLHFDTADEGTTERPVSVRTRTAAVERFVLPKGEGKQKEAPPKARFSWGELVLDGIIEDLNIDFEHFAANGTPLRAKMSVTIKEQDAKYQLGKLGPAANTVDTATPPGQTSAGPGSSGGTVPDSTRPALGGEAAAQFAARVGLDPAVWRGVAGSLDSTLSLSAGVEIDFSAGLSAGVGIGVAVGIGAGTSLSLEASFGLGGALGASDGAMADIAAGMTLAAAGGVGAALETVQILRTKAAAAETRSSFNAVPAAPPVVRAVPSAAPSRGVASLTPTTSAASSMPNPSPPDQPRPSLRLNGLLSPAAQQSTSPAPAPPLADPRSTSFGFSVPLRPRVGSAADLRNDAIAGRIRLRPSQPTDAVLLPADPTAASWTHLPADAARSYATTAQSRRTPSRFCGCPGNCHHRGGPR